MGSKFQEYIKNTVMRCEDVIKTASNPTIRENLSFIGKMKFVLHRKLCFYCRRFTSQIKFLNKAMTKYQQDYAEGKITDQTMSEYTKNRIKDSLKNLA